MIKPPSFVEERELISRGYRHIAGVDEAGRGPLAGPVVAAAVILPYPLKVTWKNRVRESKQLNAATRTDLYRYIYDAAISIGTGIILPSTIDNCGIVKSTRMAMKQAIEQLSPPPEYLLLDYLRLPEVSIPQNGITHGDSLCFSIACASIIAKVTRDRLMTELDKEYPGYGMARHKGYCTKEHIACLYRLGPSPVHRRSFRPVSNFYHR